MATEERAVGRPRVTRWALLLALGLVGCGGPRMAEIKIVQAEPEPVVGPRATPEEARGEVPPLRALLDVRPLVPPELIPPEPPADPEPVF